jgi:hypothetical protein
MIEGLVHRGHRGGFFPVNNLLAQKVKTIGFTGELTLFRTNSAADTGEQPVHIKAWEFCGNVL